MIVVHGHVKTTKMIHVIAAVCMTVAATAGAAPSHTGSAAPAVRQAADETCTPETDSYSADRWTSARWKSCLGTYGGPHGSFQAKCWGGQTIGWSQKNCRVSGRFEIRDGQKKVVKSGSFGLSYNGLIDEPTVTTSAFRFNCDGRAHGRFTFRTSGTKAKLSGDYSHYEAAKIPDATVTHPMC
ncbi:hypothetical protein ABZ726_00150 [Streptomyces hundungensis]|uniref:hypothetical protein n=1 Tax=Streptomyces hundungensis TaxID=1077946 RepID=UPI0034016B17